MQQTRLRASQRCVELVATNLAGAVHQELRQGGQALTFPRFPDGGGSRRQEFYAQVLARIEQLGTEAI